MLSHRPGPYALQGLRSASACLIGLLAFAACDDAPSTRDRAGARDGGTDARIADASDRGPTDPGDATLPADAVVLPPSDAAPPDAAPRDAGLIIETLDVLVLLDGEPLPGALVLQGGTEPHLRTDADGRARVPIDPAVPGFPMVLASHPEARIGGEELFGGERAATIRLRRFLPDDNPGYSFQDPGDPDRRDNTNQCGHCHQTIHDDWYDSPHRNTASNPAVHDLYSGTAASLGDRARCEAAGGRWARDRLPGGGEGERCFIGVGALPTHNPACADGPCPTPADTVGCADCHAPGIDGELGGRDLLDATERAYAYGVHCDICHKVAGIDLAAPPGVAGRLRIIRPSEMGPVTLGSKFLPLTFGPSHDVPNPRMGMSQRDHFRDATLCAGCHELDAPPAPGTALDPARWPDGRLPVQSTWTEWRDGALGQATVCNDCHMPPDPTVANGADYQRFPFADIGIEGGWLRPPGHVRAHQWVGPRQPDSGMLELAGALFLRVDRSDDALTAHVRVRNAGAGHALPTGEPMRAVLLTVEARCGEMSLPAIDGDAVPDFAGAEEVRALADWTAPWPDAEPGDELRIVARPGPFHDYPGVGRFGPGALPPEARGMPVERAIYRGEITARDAQGALTLTPPTPDAAIEALLAAPGADAHRVYRTRGPTVQAGQPGFGFARVMVDADGRLLAPHFVAVDVRGDNRLLPQAEWQTRHTFPAACPDPVVTARLWYRRYTPWLAVERGWSNPDVLMTEARR